MIVENESEMRKLKPPKVKGVKNSKKNKPSNITKAQILKTSLYLAIRVQR